MSVFGAIVNKDKLCGVKLYLSTFSYHISVTFVKR